MTSGWRWSMDNLRDAYYLVQLITRQILMFLRDFIFHEFAWPTPVEEDFDHANTKTRSVGLQQADFVVLFAVCAVLFAFMILSANSPKDEASNCELSPRIEAISMAFENEATSFWSSRPTSSPLTRCHHVSCDSSVAGQTHGTDSRDVVAVRRKISRSAVSRSDVSAAQSKLSGHNANSSRSQCPHTCVKAQTSHLAAQTTPREWLIRRTRSGNVYGKYPV